MPAVFGRHHCYDPEPTSPPCEGGVGGVTLKRLAELVRQLRAAQKTGGSGYKTPAAAATATTLEKRVDDALTLILGA